MRSRAVLLGFLLVVSSAVPARADASGSISGTVTDEAGAAIARICVHAWSDDANYWDMAATDALGRYTLTDVPPGDFAVGFYDCDSPDRYMPEYYNDKPSSRDADPVHVGEGSAVTGIDAQLQKTGSISGRVVDETGEPIPGICIKVQRVPPPCPGGLPCTIATAVGAPPMTDRRGLFVAAGLRPDDYHVGFYGCGNSSRYAGEWYEDALRRENAAVLAVRAGTETTDVNATLVIGGSIAGTVTDQTGSPIEGICASSAEEFFRMAATDAAGKYTIEGLQGGTAKLGFSDCRNRERRYMSEWYDDAPSRETAEPIEVAWGELRSGIDAALTLGGSISGRVTSERGAEIRACFSVYEDDGIVAGSVTGENGMYVVGGLRAGSYTVSFRDCDLGYHLPEWYDDVATQAEATPVAVSLSQDSPGIDAVLALGPAPDTSVASVSVDPPSPTAPIDTTRRVHVVLTNAGSVLPRTSGYLEVRACPVTAGGCSLVGSSRVDPIEPGATRDLTLQWPGLVGAGDYTVEAVLDMFDDVDPSNNTAATPHSILVEGTGVGFGLF